MWFTNVGFHIFTEKLLYIKMSKKLQIKIYNLINLEIYRDFIEEIFF